MIFKELYLLLHHKKRNKVEEALKWYVVGTTSTRQEIKIRDGLRRAGIESFVPLRYEVKRVRDRQVRKLTPAIAGLVFAHTTVKDYAQGTRDTLFLRKSAYSNHKDYLTVAEREMEMFIQLTTSFSEDVTYFAPSEVTLHEGDLVKITIGSQTYEAEIKRIGGKRGKKLVVEIPDVTTAAITLTPDLLKVITKLSGEKYEKNRQQRERTKKRVLEANGRTDERRSRNVEADKKALYDTAFRLLFTIPDQYQQEMEYHLAMTELRRVRQRLQTFKGVTPALEGELALGMYLADVKLEEGVEQATERLKNAIGKLKDSSMLKLRMRLFLARLSGDDKGLQEIATTVKGWNRLRLSPRQAAFLEEYRLVVPEK